MNFEWAISQLKEGKAVRRKAWNGDFSYIKLWKLDKLHSEDEVQAYLDEVLERLFDGQELNDTDIHADDWVGTKR